jgi:hypothetical protein
MHSSLTM